LQLDTNSFLILENSSFRSQHVLQLFNRSGKSDGYLNGVRHRKDISENSPKNTGLLLGKVLDTKKGYVKVKLLETIDLHDGIEILGEKTVSNIVTCIRDEKFNLLNSRQEKDTIVWIGDIDKAEKGSIIKLQRKGLKRLTIPARSGKTIRQPWARL